MGEFIRSAKNQMQEDCGVKLFRKKNKNLDSLNVVTCEVIGHKMSDPNNSAYHVISWS